MNIIHDDESGSSTKTITTKNKDHHNDHHWWPSAKTITLSSSSSSSSSSSPSSSWQLEKLESAWPATRRSWTLATAPSRSKSSKAKQLREFVESKRLKIKHGIRFAPGNCVILTLHTNNKTYQGIKFYTNWYQRLSKHVWTQSFHFGWMPLLTRRPPQHCVGT